jgi:hypothetical protein
MFMVERNDIFETKNTLTDAEMIEIFGTNFMGVVKKQHLLFATTTKEPGKNATRKVYTLSQVAKAVWAYYIYEPQARAHAKKIMFGGLHGIISGETFSEIRGQNWWPEMEVKFDQRGWNLEEVVNLLVLENTIPYNQIATKVRKARRNGL